MPVVLVQSRSGQYSHIHRRIHKMEFGLKYVMCDQFTLNLLHPRH